MRCLSCDPELVQFLNLWKVPDILAMHFIAKLGHDSKVVGTGEWESSWWAVSEARAQRLVDEAGSIYLHSARSEPSHWGGTVIGYRVQQGGETDGRTVFRFRPSLQHKGVRTDGNGRGQEKKFVGFKHSSAE